MTLKAIIFDVDGTLAETEELHREAFNHLFKKYELGWYWDKQLYKKLLKVAGGKERIRYYINEFLDISENEKATFNEEFIKTIHKEKTEKYVSLLCNSGLKFRIGVERLIKELLESNLKIAIATTTSHVNVLKLLSNLDMPNIQQIFDVLATGDQVTKQKPAPDLYHLSLEKLALKPNECLAIEDTTNGLKAASKANIPTIITPSSYSYDEDFTGAACVIDHIGEGQNKSKILAGIKFSSPYLNIAALQEIHKKYIKNS